jgi:hypothetical protein
MGEYVEEVGLQTLQCYTCGIIFAIPKAFMKNRKEDGVSFRCPNSHTLSYPKKDENGETQQDRLGRLEEENSTLKTTNIRLMSQLDQTEAQLAATQPSSDVNTNSKDDDDDV